MKTKNFYSKMLFLFIGLIFGFTQLGYSHGYCTPTVTYGNPSNYGIGMTNVTMTGATLSFNNPSTAQNGTNAIYNDYSSTCIVNGRGGDVIPFSVTTGGGNATQFS